ncbi:hypothetical protein MT418_005691 [Batrachochytrium dendrobatidis]
MPSTNAMSVLHQHHLPLEPTAILQQQMLSMTMHAFNMQQQSQQQQLSQSSEEITTIFVVGFPEDMSDREFQNMFIFSTGFEAAALKVPMPGELDEQTGQLKRQIIGFAKFRTRSEAVKARDVLNGRRIDVDRGAILKAEIAKKNLKNFTTKRQPSLLDTAMFAAFGPSLSHQGPLLSADALGSLAIHDLPLSTSQNNSNGSNLASSGLMSISEANASRFDLGLLSSNGNTSNSFASGASNSSDDSSAQCPVGISINGARRSSAAMAASLSTDDKMSPFPDIFDVTTRASFLGSLTTPSTTHNNNSNTSLSNHISHSYQSSFPIDVPCDYNDAFDHAPATSSSLFGTSASSAFIGERGFNSALYNSDSLLTGRFQNFHLGDGLGNNHNNGNSMINGIGNYAIHSSDRTAGANGNQSQYSYSSSFPGTTMATNNAGAIPFISGMDQNPPCNTLYVGNLPHDALEEELRQIFTVQSGFKRLCFRTRANGPMCFVEFESVDYATAALFQLYGNHLSNSTKGGIRLSYSKNPLGVRQNRSAVVPGMMGAGIGGLGGYIPSTLSTAMPTPIPAISSGAIELIH